MLNVFTSFHPIPGINSNLQPELITFIQLFQWRVKYVFRLSYYPNKNKSVDQTGEGNKCPKTWAWYTWSLLFEWFSGMKMLMYENRNRTTHIYWDYQTPRRKTPTQIWKRMSGSFLTRIWFLHSKIILLCRFVAYEHFISLTCYSLYLI